MPESSNTTELRRPVARARYLNNLNPTLRAWHSPEGRADGRITSHRGSILHRTEWTRSSTNGPSRCLFELRSVATASSKQFGCLSIPDQTLLVPALAATILSLVSRC